MSLPSLSTVLRGILPGSPPYKGSGSQRDVSGHRAAAPGGGGGSTPATPGGQVPSHQDLALTPEAASQRSENSGGYRRRREELEAMGEIESPGGGSVFSDNSCSTATYGGVGGSWAGSSWEGSDYEGSAPSSTDYEAMQQRGGGGAAAGASSVGVVGRGAYGLSSGCTSKRAKLTSRSLSRLTDEPVNGMGIIEGSDIGSMVGGGARTRRGPLERSMSAALDGGGSGQRSGRVFEQSMSHSTEEWRAMSKAGRVLGVDSLEERDVEDQRRASSVKAARILGVENVAELQQSAAAARERQKWAPPRSSASKAARMLGVKDPHDDVKNVEEKEGRRGRKQTTKITGRRSRSLSTRGAKRSSGSKPRQGGITSLIRALEINGSSEAGSTSQNGSGSSENGDCSSLDYNYNGGEDLPHKKGRGKQETGSKCSTRATESCSSLSDLAHTDPDGLSCHGGSSRGGSSVSGHQQQNQEQQKKQQQQQQQHTRQQPELSDDSQLVGLQTPGHSSSSAAGPDGLRGFSRHTRDDDMDIETPPSQPRSAALTSLRKAPAPLLAPYTPSLAPAPAAAVAAAAAPSPEAGPAPSPSGSPSLQQPPPPMQQQQHQQVARHASAFALNETGAWPSPTVSAIADGKSGGGSMMMMAEEKGGRRATRVSEVLDDSPSTAASVGERDRDRDSFQGSWPRGWSRASAATVSASAAQQQQQQQRRPSSAPFDGRLGAGGGSGFRLPDPIPSSSPSSSSWGTTTDAAGCKETRPDGWSEYKQESPVALQLRGRELPPRDAFAGAAAAAAAAACDEKRERWSNSGLGSQQQQQQQQHPLPEFKHEPADVTLHSTANGWEHQPAQPVGLVSSGAAGVYPYPHPQFRHHQFQQQHQQWQQRQQHHQQQQQHAMAAARTFPPHNSHQDHQRYQHASSSSPARVTMSPVVNGRTAAGSSGSGSRESTVPGYGFPLASVGGSESSGDSDSMCDTFPDRMDEGVGPAPSSAFEALAAMIPVVNPMGIARQQIQHPVGATATPGQRVKVEELCVGGGPVARAATATATAVAGRPKAPKPGRRRANPPGDQCVVPVAHSPLVSSGGRGFAKQPGARKNTGAGAGSVPPASLSSSADDGTAAGSGISTRKQQEVATRPRQKGRFVKRAPAFLPISAFKPASDRNEAAEAAEAAEEARQKADEAAAVAAAAAASAAAQQRLETAKTPSTSDMMPPPPPAAVTGRFEFEKGGDADREVAPSSTVVGEKHKQKGVQDRDSHRGANPVKAVYSAASSTKPSTAAAASRRGGGGGAGATRGRGERRMASPPSCTNSMMMNPSNDIWFGEGEDRLAGQGDGDEGNFGGGCARDRSVSSDGGSERGSEGGGELRGMAFLPCSPMDRSSPGGGGQGRSSSAWDSPSPRRSGSNANGCGSSTSTPASSARRGSGSGRSSMSCASSSSSLSSSLSSSSSYSSMCSPTGGGGALLSAPLLADVPMVSGGRRGGGGGGGGDGNN